MDPIKAFQHEVASNIRELGDDKELTEQSRAWMESAGRHKYSYNFRWMGRPIIQFPQDMIAMQEIIWDTKPDLIIETGIAHGGSLIYYASILELMGKGSILGIDIDIRDHNRKQIESHPMFHRIEMIQGSSVDNDIAAQVSKKAEQHDSIMVVLDSNHTHEHVLAELELYAPLVSPGNYLVVFDTAIEYMPPDSFPDRPWGVGDNPMTAVREFLDKHDNFEVDRDIVSKLLITVAPDGYLKCKKN